MKCEICGKDILKDSQCIDYKYYHNDCIINLTKENKELKKELEEYKRLGFKYLNDKCSKLEKENKILRENAEHNDKVVDKINWENLKLKKQLEEASNGVKEVMSCDDRRDV